LIERALCGHDLPAAWNAPTTDTRTRRRLARILIKEVVIDPDEQTNEALATIHWTSGKHTELRVPRVKCGGYSEDQRPNPAAVTMNRMRCKSPDGKSLTTVRVRELRERLEFPEFDPNTVDGETISADETASRLKIGIGSVHLLIRHGVLPATQLMPCAPWKVPVEPSPPPSTGGADAAP
jgi:hypothetical protein